jgi:hypothetical protein
MILSALEHARHSQTCHDVRELFTPTSIDVAPLQPEEAAEMAIRLPDEASRWSGNATVNAM